MRTINIGKLNKRLKIMGFVDRKDAIGQSSKALEEIKTVWGSLYPIRGNEMYEVQKVQGKTSHKCYIRYMKDIDSNCYIKYEDKTYSITSVIDVDMEHKLLEIYCDEYINKESV